MTGHGKRHEKRSHFTSEWLIFTHRDGTSLSMWSGRQTVFCVTYGNILLSFTTLQAEEKKNYWYGVPFMILGISIFESLEWCEHPVFLRVGTKLSGVIMGDV